MPADETRVRILRELLERNEKRYTEEEQASRLVHLIAESYDLKSAAVLSLGQEGAAPSVFAHRGLSHHFIKEMYTRRDQPLIEAAARGEVSVKEGDPRQKDPAFRLEHEYRSLFAAPCRIRGEEVGVLVADSAKPDLFRAEVREAFLAYARFAAVLLMMRRLRDSIPRVPDVDAVTGLFTFKEFHELLDRDIRRGETVRHPVSLVFLKIRGLRELNNVYGHIAGDLALKTVAARIRAGMRSVDYAARSGATVYIAMPQVPKGDAAKAAERIVGAMNAEPVGRGDISIRLAIGIAEHPGDGETERVLIPHVEAMVLESIRRGGHAISIYRD